MTVKKILLIAFAVITGFTQAQVKKKTQTTKKPKIEKKWVNPVKLTKEERNRPYMDEVLKTRDSLTPQEAERRRKNIAIGNPFAKYGVYPKIATLSKGKYLEFHDTDSIVVIGSVRYNTKRGNIIEVREIDLSDPDAQPIGDTHGRWMSPDPLSEEFPSWTPYNYVENNPINKIDPTGLSSESTHTDKFGNVVAVYKDGDLGVYRHNGNAQETKQELNQNYSKDNTSGGGDRMGRTLVWDSFNNGKGNPTGKIDFGSYAARDWLNGFSDAISKDVEANGGFVARMNYAWNGGNGDKYDYKSQNGGGLYSGSQIEEGVYVSARDVGNFAAGRAAFLTGQSKMDFMLNAGGFNLSGNSKMGLIFNNSYWKSEAKKAGFPAYGEAFNSNLFQRLGYENVTTAQGIIKKSKIIWGDKK